MPQLFKLNFGLTIWGRAWRSAFMNPGGMKPGSTGWRANLVLRVKRNMTSGYANAWKRRIGASQKLANAANYRRPKKNDH